MTQDIDGREHLGCDDARVGRDPVLEQVRRILADGNAARALQVIDAALADTVSNVARPQNGESNAPTVVGKSTGDRTLGHERRSTVEEGSRGERGACRDELRAGGAQRGARAAGDEAGRSEVTEAGRGNSAPAGSAPVVQRRQPYREVTLYCPKCDGPRGVKPRSVSTTCERCGHLYAYIEPKDGYEFDDVPPKRRFPTTCLKPDALDSACPCCQRWFYAAYGQYEPPEVQSEVARP